MTHTLDEVPVFHRPSMGTRESELQSAMYRNYKMKLESKHRVELHIHLDGAMRAATIFDIAKERDIVLRFDDRHQDFKSAQELGEFIRIKECGTLRDFLRFFPVFMSPFQGYKQGIARFCREFIEDCANNKLCYVETRFCPHLLVGPELDVDGVVKTVLESLHSAGKEHGVKVGVILTALRELPQFAVDLIRLVEAFQSHGVVGIDVAGDEQLFHEDGQTHEAVVKLFNEAKQRKIHRTVHAGENGPAPCVREALFEMHAERVGHGYHALDDPKLYQHMLHSGIHFELCPLSSRLTSSVDTSNWALHPIHRLSADRASYSINTDDPVCTGNWMNDEYKLCLTEIGLPPWELVRANYSAARACFLPDEEKLDLLEHLDKVYSGKL